MADGIIHKNVAALHLIHGMMEHSGRYAGYLAWMKNQGFAVYSTDMPGHGKAARGQADLGHLDIKSGWKEVLDEVCRVQRTIRQENPGIPVFLIGHSFGSVVARSFAERYGKEYPLAGLVLSGAMQQPPALLKAGQILVGLQKAVYGQEHRSRLLIVLGHGQYYKKFLPKRTDFDWLCSDPSVVDAYLSDPLCGYACSLGFYQNFFQALLDTWKCANIRKLRLEMPVLVLGGQQDPAVNQGRDLEKIAEKYRNCGMKHVQLKMYPQGRHEMLNEFNKSEVWQTISDWMNESL